jgi:uncharacterized membrane protein YhfC
MSFNYTVPTLSIVFMSVAALAGVAIPAVLFLVLRKKYGADISPFFIGCAVFAVFAMLLEALVHRAVLYSELGKDIQNNVWLFGIYGGLMAGLFEETGRYAAFKTVLKKKLGSNRNALMYGAGHGGFEAFYILVFSFVPYIVMAIQLNAGKAGSLTAGVTDEAALQNLQATFAALAQAAPADFLVSIVERIAAVIIHLSCSVLVWFAAKDGRRRFWLFPLALLLHALVDAVAVVLARNGLHTWIIEGVIYVLAAGLAWIAAVVWRKSDHSTSADNPPDEGATDQI